MGSNGIAWTAEVPEPRGEKLDIWHAPTYGAWEYVVLSDDLIGVLTHWWDGRTIPCRRSIGACPCLRQVVDVRWKGYLAVLAGPKRVVGLAEITEEAAAHCAFLHSKDRGSLRGMTLRVSRLYQAPRAPARMALIAPVTPSVELPPAPDVMAALLRVWSGRTRPRPEADG